MERKVFEAWDKIFTAKNYDLSQDLHFITATEIKKLSGGAEARIMAKIDTSNDLPPVFKRNGYILLPVKNGKYAIVRGNGFHLLEGLGEVADYKSRVKFNLTTAGRGQSEMQYLDYSHNAGALEDVLNVGSLYPSIRGREYTKSFDFRINKTILKTESVQTEVDLGLEGEDSIVLCEAKINMPEDFIIRQLFYPYRNFQIISPGKKIIPVFFVYDLAKKTYNFWIYKFTDAKNYNSIELVQTSSVKIGVANIVKLSEIKPQGITTGQKYLIPQANDLDKVIEFVFKVKEGVNNSKSIAKHFEFNERQSSYYREAAEAVGLIESSKGKYLLTDVGKMMTDLNTEERNIFFAKLLTEFGLVKESMEMLKAKKSLTKADIESLIREKSPLSGTTIGRRADSLFSWLKWISERTGIFVEKDKKFEVIV